ncbi:protein Mpv17 isoform X2 [Zootermopsis nevadensis]|uniref:Mitochondrial inner membrane protein Mpv17 n=2 Tax=Zootermopsis nevadensis TaxID=136037 RepID=A0A067QX40_ZOONE|nr:protein Mpv17 isoform X2 [Zootermopsis nevadensis]KDR14760.1 Protein Mpv17 [Zootermopsis nevadensis]
MKHLRKLFGVYRAVLYTHPVYTQALQSSFLMGVGDVLSQTVFEDKGIKNIDKGRVIRFAGIGFFFMGPALQLWYMRLAKFKAKSSYVQTAKKVAADQLVAAPVILCTVMSSVSLMEGHNVEQTKEKLKNDYFEVLLTNYKVWPLVQFLNFSLVPVNFQVLLVQAVAIFWNSYLSFKSHKNYEERQDT